LKIFENTDVFEAVRLGVGVVDWGILVIVDDEPDLVGIVDNKFIDVWESGLINLLGLLTRCIGIGGGNGIVGNENLSVSFDIEKWTDELDDDDDEGEW
jgi:hypothetical protein